MARDDIVSIEGSWHGALMIDESLLFMAVLVKKGVSLVEEQRSTPYSSIQMLGADTDMRTCM